MSILNMIFIFIVLFLYLIIDIMLFSFPVFGLLTVTRILMILVSISPLGAFLLRTAYGAKKVRTQKDKSILFPLISTVTLSAHRHQSVQIYIDSDFSVNAYCIGNSIVVTRGAIKFLKSFELKAIFAHELGHIVNGDTIRPMVLLFGSIWGVLILLLTQAIKILFNLNSKNRKKRFRQESALSFIATMIISILDFIVITATFVFQIIISVVNRKCEYEADRFAKRIGYREGLISALYSIRELDFEGKVSFKDRLLSSHPDIDKRIERLEVSLLKYRRVY